MADSLCSTAETSITVKQLDSNKILNINNHPPPPSLVAQTVKCLPTTRETRVQSLSWEDPLEKEMAIHFSILAWKIPWTEEPGRLQLMGSQSQTRLSDFTFTSLTNPPQKKSVKGNAKVAV